MGRTGSGKTQAAMWHLSMANFDRMPYVILDFKTDDSINNIEHATHLDGYNDVPKSPGIYVLHPLPSETEQVEQYLYKLWAKERVGIYCDEGYMLQDNEAFIACLTQGRSKQIPMIVLTQRPAWISRFVFSEADFYQVFALNDSRDRKTIASFVPGNFKDKVKLPNYHSYYYDVAEDNLRVLGPVPEMNEIHEKIESRLDKKRRKWL